MHARFLGLLPILLLLMALTAYKARLLWPKHRARSMLLLIPLFFLMIGGQFLYRANPAILEESWFRAFAWVGGVTLGVWASFTIFSLPLDLFHLLTSLFERVKPTSRFAPERRLLLMRGMGFSLLGLSGGIGGLGLMEVVRGPRIKEVLIPVGHLPSALAGLKIAQISDLHVGATIRRAYVEDVVERTNATDPDLIFVTGDLADASASMVAESLEPLAKLKARNGVYYVTGNHEYFWDPEGLISMMKTLGLKPLLNENQVLTVNGVKLLLAGITDPAGAQYLEAHAPDTQKAIACREKTDLKILLAHRPEACYEAEKAGFDLQFSGHTHGGQFFPFSILVSLAHKYVRGLNRHGKMWVYVNSGTGYWGPANRFTVAPEITLATLASTTMSRNS